MQSAPRCTMEVSGDRLQCDPGEGNTLLVWQEVAAISVHQGSPHLGLLNGGYHAFVEHGVWDNPSVYADTSLASRHDIKDYIDNFGFNRILFGSDFPFGDPKQELSKIMDLSIPRENKEMILGHNLKCLLENSNI